MTPFCEHHHHQQQHTRCPLTPTSSQNTPHGAKSPRPILKTSESSTGSLDSSCQRYARFSKHIDVKVIPEFLAEEFSIFFYDDDELAKFRHDAFLEACGLDPNDFD